MAKTHNWFGEMLTRKEIADRYGFHPVTISSYFRAYKTCDAVMARIDEVKRHGFVRQRKGSMIDVSDLAPRRDISTIPDPTEYERRLWGR